jgi:NADPH:quinone reductase-like Zn-dependent oxidoreductase
MKAVVIEAFGGLDELKLKEMPIPQIQDHEVLIGVEYAAVNPVDWKIREGYLESALPHEFPVIPGWDASGVIASIGKHVKNFKAGDLVYTYCRKPTVHDGAYAEYVTFDAANVAKKPKNISFAQAAAIPLAGLTAWQALFDFCHLKKGQTILIHAGAGGVGGFAIQFAKYAGANVITTCSKNNFDYVKKLGADHIIDYSKEDFRDAVRKIAKEGVDIAFDTVGGDTLAKSLEIVKKKGTLVTIVQRLGPEYGSKAQVKTGFVFVRPDGQELGNIAKLIESGIVLPPEIQEMRLSDAAKAQEMSKLGHTRGKIVLKIR